MTGQDWPDNTPSASALPRGWRPWTWLRLGVVVLLAVVASAACVAELTRPTDITPTRSMMIGTWRSATGAQLVLRSDGTFTGQSLPRTFGGFVAWAPRQGSGMWHVAFKQPSGVVFNFADYRTEIELGLERAGTAVILYYDKGDPDQGLTGQYQFTKVGAG